MQPDKQALNLPMALVAPECATILSRLQPASFSCFVCGALSAQRHVLGQGPYQETLFPAANEFQPAQTIANLFIVQPQAAGQTEPVYLEGFECLSTASSFF